MCVSAGVRARLLLQDLRNHRQELRSLVSL
jgi:hypothetical protein